MRSARLTDGLSCVAFLLENGKAYHIANATGLVEFLVTSYFAPDFKRIPYLFPLGARCYHVFRACMTY